MIPRNFFKQNYTYFLFIKVPNMLITFQIFQQNVQNINSRNNI